MSRTLLALIAATLAALAMVLWPFAALAQAPGQAPPFAYLVTIQDGEGYLSEYRVLRNIPPWTRVEFGGAVFPAIVVEFVPVWTTPQQPLTPARINELWAKNTTRNVVNFVRAVEAEHGITGATK